jgi:CDP-diacylglycerol--glycerol-3-phosphate 3-phosphatidyltransferase
LFAVTLDREAYLTRWAELHGGFDPRSSVWVGGWLRLSYVAARPLAAARVSPDTLTGAGLLASALVPLLCLGRGAGWVLLAGLLVVGSGLLDTLDGAVAILTDRATRFGHVLDSVVDRVSDAAYVVALWVLGAPAWLCILGGALSWLLEYSRARAAAGGMAEIGVVTVWERGTRITVTAIFLGCAALFGVRLWSTLGAAAWVGLGVVGLAQLLVVIRRRLR